VKDEWYPLLNSQNIFTQATGYLKTPIYAFRSIKLMWKIFIADYKKDKAH
jgi:hypothetical protein